MSKISAFVITCDKDPAILRAALAAARFADELVLINKGRRHGNLVSMAAGCQAHYVKEEWSPTVEPTRSAALAACSHDWIVCLDDDEILSPACAATVRDFIASGSADVLQIPIKHYILGRHEPRAYYWPEWRPTLFRRGAVEFGPAVHGGTRIVGRAERLPQDHPAFITHLSHPDIATWLEKTNRYTSQADRCGVEMPDFEPSPDCGPEWKVRWLGDWAMKTLANHVQQGRGDPYLDAAAILRGLYDIIDGLKQWEATQPDGNAAFAEIAQAEIERERQQRRVVSYRVPRRSSHGPK